MTSTQTLHRVTSALPDARIEVLDGQQHIAHRLAPEVFARRVLAFLHDGVDRRAHAPATAGRPVSVRPLRAGRDR